MLKKYSGWIVAALVVVLAITLFMLFRKTARQNSNERGAELLNHQPIDTNRNQIGELSAKLEQARIDLSTLKAARKSEVDSLCRELRIRPKDLVQGQRIVIKTERVEVKVPYAVDSVMKVQKFSYIDNWLTLKGKVMGDYVEFDSIKTFNKLHITHYEKRKNWYNLRKTLMVNIKDENIHDVSIEATSYQIEERPKRWVFGAGAGVGYSGDKIQPNIGLYVVYKVFEF